MMSNTIFYDNPESLEQDEILRPKPNVSRRSSILQKVKRSFSIDKKDCQKMESMTISRLMAQSLSIQHRLVNHYTSQSNINIPEEEKKSEETTERSEIFYSAPAVVIRRKSLKGRTAKEKFERPSETKRRKSISNLYEDEKERGKIKDVDRDKKKEKDKDEEKMEVENKVDADEEEEATEGECKEVPEKESHQNHLVPEQVLKYERLSFQGFEHMPSEINVKKDDSDKCKQNLSRKLSIKPKPGTVKSLVKKFEILEGDRTSINVRTKMRTNSEIDCISEDYEGEQNTQNKENSTEVEENDDITVKIKTDDLPTTEDSQSANQENNSSGKAVLAMVKEMKKNSRYSLVEDDGTAFSERDSIDSNADDVFNDQVELRKHESIDSGFSSYKTPDQIFSGEMHRLSDGTTRMSVDSSNSASSCECRDDESDLSPADDFQSSEEENEKSTMSPFRYLKPLYQFYSRAADAAARAKIARSVLSDESRDSETEELPQTPHALDLVDNKTRIYWRDVPAVQESGYLTTLSDREKRKQEAKFEILISEASYVKSLQVLEKHYMKNLQYLTKSSKFFTERDYRSLFGNITEVRKCSENFLHDLNKHWLHDILLTDIYDIIRNHATNSFRPYIRYSTQFLNMTLKYNEMINEKPDMKLTLDLLRNHPWAKNLPLDSFLALPIQRITRFPLLMNNLLQFTDDNSEEYKTGIVILRMLKKLAQECDDEIEKRKRTEEMLRISQQIDFLPEIEWIPILKSNRYLVLQTKVQHFMFRDKAMRKLGLQLYLFDDILLITKRSSNRPINEEHWSVIDYCNRELVQAEAMDKLYLLGIPELAETNAISLSLQCNCKGEKSEMVVSFQRLSDRERWLAALTPSSSDSLRKTLATEPDSSIQVTAINNYKASRPDELSLWIGDVVNVIGEPMEGWCRGEKLRNGKIGWFPKSCVVEIKDEHVKQANMKLKKERQMNTEQFQQELDRKSSLFESYA